MPVPKSNAPEVRTLPTAAAELRGVPAADGKPAGLVGYASVYDSLSEPLAPGFRERIAPGAFSLALARNPDVRALVDHNPSLILGRTKSGTLRLSNTSKGLRCEIDLPDTTVGRDLMESVRRGDVDGMSFGFRCVDADWADEVHDGEMCFVRTVRDLELFDVSPVTYPAYPATEITERSLSTARGVRGLDPDTARLILRVRTAE